MRQIVQIEIVCYAYFDFFQRTKLRQPTGQRELLELESILSNILTH